MATTTTMQVQFRTVDGVRIRYADGGDSREQAVLLTSPWPESVYAFEPMWATLAEQARLFAIDLPGFGASERREDLRRGIVGVWAAADSLALWTSCRSAATSSGHASSSSISGSGMGGDDHFG